MDSKNKEKQEKNYHSLTNLYESIYLTGNLDNINLNGETIDKPIALFRRDDFGLISGNHLFQEKFVTPKSKPHLQDYIKPYTIREILGFSQGNCFLVKP